MGMSTFTGPITAGDVLDTTGSTVGSLKNVGFAHMSQTVAVTQATNGTTPGLYTTSIVIPAQSQITSIRLYVTTAWNGSAATFNIGTSATATELAVAATAANTGVAVGIVNVDPGTSATRVNNWVDVGNSDVQIFMLSTNTGAGVGWLTVNYNQAMNLVP